MPSISEYLDTILDHIRSGGGRAADVNEPGVSEERVREVLAQRELVPTRELVELYAWRNGSSDVDLWPIYPMLSLHHSAVAYDINQEFCPPGWWPIFADAFGVTLFAVCGRTESSASPVVSYFDGGDATVESASITRMLETQVACFEQGLYPMEDGEFADFDPAAVESAMNQVDLMCSLNAVVETPIL